MRALLILLVFVASVSAAPWPGVPYSEVRGYAYNHKRNGLLVRDGKLGPTIVNKAGVPLTSRQINRLIVAVSGKRSGTIDIVECWDPHHGFVFFDARGKAVAWVEVCFKCGNMHSTPPADGVYDMKALRKLSNELKLPDPPKT
jgi:hypothetical protein